MDSGKAVNATKAKRDCWRSAKYRELGVPLDGIIQDWRYWGSNYLWNAMDFLNEEFSDPKK